MTLRRVIAWIPRCHHVKFYLQTFIRLDCIGLARYVRGGQVHAYLMTRVHQHARVPRVHMYLYSASARGGRWGKYAPTLRLRQVAVFKSPETYARLERRDEQPAACSWFSPLPRPLDTLYFHCLSKASRKGTVADNRDRRRYLCLKDCGDGAVGMHIPAYWPRVSVCFLFISPVKRKERLLSPSQLLSGVPLAGNSFLGRM